MSQTVEQVQNYIQQRYKAGFYTDIEVDQAPMGLNEEIIAMISAKKDEPEWLLERRLKAYAQWQKRVGPDWAHVGIPAIDCEALRYHDAPPQEARPHSLGA